MDQLREAPVIARHACDGGVTRQLEAVHYDTVDRTLFGHRLALRVRRDGGRYVQTLKRGPTALHGSRHGCIEAAQSPGCDRARP
ncbi:MAG TPA: CYTH domain-containing protein [Acetobacteraceae bacterium]|nr:CYTH domain-containing protein [Acetobacteraceae bacterium]